MDINKAVENALKIANDDRHGYDQLNRNSPDYDCSSFVATCLHNAGFPVSKSSWTGNIRKQLLKCGFKSIDVNEKRKKGDIFLTEGKHIVMCTSEKKIVHASINEKGTTTGGKPGDQTGKEICERTFYTPAYGWDYHLRYVGNPIKNTENATKVVAKNPARYFNKAFAGLYTVTATALSVRHGGGTRYDKIVIIAKGTKVRCYGYYSISDKVIWLYVQFYYGGTEYTGFCSSVYLK